MNDKYLKRVDLIHNQVERERLREQEATKSRNKIIQQQNAKRFADYQKILRAELEARIFANIMSTGGDTDISPGISNNYVDDGYIDNYFE